MTLAEVYQSNDPIPAARPTFQHRFNELLDQIQGVVVISPQKARLALLGLFAQGHVLLEDLPGVGKTLLAKTIAGCIDGRFSRIQFTPDLLPGDITGSSVFDSSNQTFSFVPGPIFANVVVADELNRTGPRTQSALLEAMSECAVSSDGEVWQLPRPFLIIATQNLIETYGTFPLPNSQLDRFMISMELGLPTPEQEMEILRRSEEGTRQVRPLLSQADVVEMQDTVSKVQLAGPDREYIVNLAAATRQSGDISVGVSPRGSTVLQKACQAWAAFDGRSFVVPEDVQDLAPYIWAHRIEVDMDQDTASGRRAITDLLRSVPVPL